MEAQDQYKLWLVCQGGTNVKDAMMLFTDNGDTGELHRLTSNGQAADGEAFEPVCWLPLDDRTC